MKTIIGKCSKVEIRRAGDPIHTAQFESLPAQNGNGPVPGLRSSVELLNVPGFGGFEHGALYRFSVEPCLAPDADPPSVLTPSEAMADAAAASVTEEEIAAFAAAQADQARAGVAHTMSAMGFGVVYHQRSRMFTYLAASPSERSIADIVDD